MPQPAPPLSPRLPEDRPRRRRCGGHRRTASRAGGREDPDRLLADRQRPAALRRPRARHLQGGWPQCRRHEIRERAAGRRGDDRRPHPRLGERHGVGGAGAGRDHVSRPVQDHLLQPEQPQAGARRGAGLKGQPDQVDRRAQGQEGGERGGHPERDAGPTALLKEQPAEAKTYIAAYAKAVEFVRTHPDESRRSLDGFTAIDATLVKEVPLSGFTLYNEVPTPRPGLDWP